MTGPQFAREPEELEGAPGRREEPRSRADGLVPASPRPTSASPAGNPLLHRDSRSQARRVLPAASTPATHPSAHPGRIAWWLWVLLVGSLVLFAMVRVYVRHEEARLSKPLGEVPALQVAGPTVPVRAGALDLTWSEVPGATVYRLSVTSITGQIVVDALPVDGTEWIPPDEALPALARGDYRWFVEALDEEGLVLATSAESTFRVM